MSSAHGPRVLLACDFHLHYSAMLASALDRAGAEVALLTRDHDLEFGGSPGAAREFVDETIGSRVTWQRIAGRQRSLRGWVRAIGLRRKMGTPKPDVVHVQESVGNDLRLLLASGVRPGSFALTVHDPVRHPGDQDSRRLAWLNGSLVRTAGLIFVHGEALRDELVTLARPRAPIVVVPHGVDPAESVPLPASQSILFFGRISHYKGIDTLLDAMGEVWRTLPNATLTIAGAGGLEPHQALSDARVTVLNRFIAESELTTMFEAARCVALPYRQASQSGVGSRVKAYARPLVATAVGGLPELVSDGSGLLVPPEKPTELAEALVSVLTDDELASELAEAGAATAARKGSWDVVAERTLAAYGEHLGVEH